MQQTDQNLEGAVSPAPIEPDSDTYLTPAETDDIFTLAEAEIQPMLRKMRRERWTGWVQGVLCIALILFSLAGIVWQCITYPHTLVIISAKEYPTSISATLAVPTRTLTPVTLTRSQTAPTTGSGHQDARAATGTLMFYNGSATPQYVPGGSVFTGNDGVKVTIEHSSTVAAANLPAIGSLTVAASAMLAGSHGNIAAFDINLALSSVLKVRNEAPFTNGRDARSYQAVAPQDLTTLTSQVNETVTQAFTTAFPLRRDEEAIPTQCHTATSTNYRIGEAAQSVTLTVSQTCSAVAYKRDELTREAAAAFSHTKPAAAYRLVGSVRTTVESVSPVSVTISGTWVYTFSSDYEQSLAERIAGDSPVQAKASLLKTGVISYASVPTTLPPAMYITFVVLEGR